MSNFEFVHTPLEGAILVKPKVYGDMRGYFYETYKKSVFQEAGIVDDFHQSNQSSSQKGVVRGLHFQLPPFAQAKLVRCIKGEIFDVGLDLRTESPTYGNYYGTILSDENKCMLYLPEGFAHGFEVISDNAEIHYLASNEYAPESDRGLIWNDPDIAIAWKTKNPILSGKDLVLPRLKDLISPF